MAPGSVRTLLLFLITLSTPGWAAEKPNLRPVKQPAVERGMREKGMRERWEPSIHLDGKPVERLTLSPNKPPRAPRLSKAGRDGPTHLLEDIEPEWVNLDGFAVLAADAVSSAGPVRSPPASNHSLVAREVKGAYRMFQNPSTSRTRTHRRAPQSSAGPRQPDTVWPIGGLQSSSGPRQPIGAETRRERRQQHHTQPQSDQRTRHRPKLTSESVHVVSLQAQKARGQSAPATRVTKTTTPEPPEYEARDISVRVMSPQSVLISWVDPAVEMGKVAPGAGRSYTVRFREKGESARWEYRDSNQRRIMVESLSADSMYEFSVRISREDNPGKWSVSVFQRTPESAPSGPPDNFEVKPLRGKGTAVIATWDPPEEPNGRIREYILSYAPAMKPFGMKTVTYRGSTSTATIDGLTPGDRYIFKIRATNRRGMGPQSKAFSVVMPGSSSAASSFSKAKDELRIPLAPSQQETDLDDSRFQSTNIPEESTTTAQPRPVAPNSRRTRPLSQTRSYHSIFSVRGSVRNPLNRGSTRGQAREDEEDQEEEEVPTTQSPPEETTMEVVPETEEPDNDVPPESGLEKAAATETPSLKVVTASPTKPRPPPPKRRPVKIRVHPKSKPASSSANSSFSSSDSSSASNPSSSSIFPTTSLTSSSQESAASRKDYVASTYPETKNIYDNPSVSLAKPSTSVLKEKSSQQTDAESTSRGSSSSLHTSLSAFPSRYGRRHSGTLLKGNSTRLLNGYKPAVTSNSHHRFPNQGMLHTSQETLPERTQNHETSRTPNRDSTAESYNTESRSSSFSQGGSHSSPKSLVPEEDAREQKAMTQSTDKKTTVSRTQVSPALAERFPWLASRYPSRAGSGTRTSPARTPWNRASSSVGAGRPPMRETPTRVSGATGASGVSSIQETSESLRTQDSLKNEDGESSIKPSWTNQHTRHPSTQSHSSSTNSQKPSSGSRDSSGSINTNEGRESHKEDYLERPGETSGRLNKDDDLKDPQKNPGLTSMDVGMNTEDKESAKETPTRTRPGFSSAGVPPFRRPGTPLNGRTRFPLGGRQFGVSRLPVRSQPAQNPEQESPALDSSSSSFDSSTNLPRLGGSTGGDSQSTSSSPSSRDVIRNNGFRPRYPAIRGKPNNGGRVKPINGNGKNGRPNLTVADVKETSPSSQGTRKAVGQRYITGPDGTKWVVDLELGVLMNQDGQILQDSHGKPKRVVVGEDGRTIFDLFGSPLVNQEGMALFGHGRDSQPVVNPKDKVLMVGGKPVVGLNPPRVRTTSTTTRAPTTTTTTTTTPEPSTTQWTTEEFMTPLPFPTCPPGTFSKTDEDGYPLLDPEGILDCYPEDDSSGMETDFLLPDALALEKDELLVQTTLAPPTTTTTEAAPMNPPNRGPSSEFDLSGKKRFTAPYVNFIQKDPGAPCSLTEALEYLQVDVLEDLIGKERLEEQNQPPKNKPHNLTVVAMEGCHSFIILDWARPLSHDMVSGFLVHSASYDDVLNNRWSSQSSSGTHLALENLKPNSRYYFKVQAKNVFGLGPVSDTLTYVTESDDPLLIERPPGGEPIWIPFSFKYNSVHSSCTGSQYVKRTWYRKLVGVVLCNSLRYKIFMGDGLREPFYSIGDSVGHGEDHCQFVDSYRDGRTGPAHLSNHLPSAQGFYRAYRQEPISFGVIGRRTTHPFVGWYECGIPIPGKW